MEGSAALVQEMYRTALKRDADADGLSLHVRLLEDTQSYGTAAMMLASLRNSDEARRQDFLTGGDVNAKPKRFVSLGTNCYCASMLKNSGKRDGAYPFDWLVSSPRMVLHCLKDDFKILLDGRYFQPAEEPGVVHHAFYRDNYGVFDTFKHSDPRRPGDYSYHQRCIGRLRAMSRNGEPATVVMASFNPTEDQETFGQLVQFLRLNAPSFSLLLISMLPPTTDGLARMGFEPVASDEGHRWLAFTPSSERDAGGLKYVNPIDDLMVRSLIEGIDRETTGGSRDGC